MKVSIQGTVGVSNEGKPIDLATVSVAGEPNDSSVDVARVYNEVKKQIKEGEEATKE